MSDDAKNTCIFSAACLFIIGVVFFIIAGPAGISRGFQKWTASAYGSDWLIVQYSMDGSIISHWNLDNKSVASEQGSDGINFVDKHGNMVHLSGHYVYVQLDGSRGREAAWKRLVEGRSQLGNK